MTVSGPMKSDTVNHQATVDGQASSEEERDRAERVAAALDDYLRQWEAGQPPDLEAWLRSQGDLGPDLAVPLEGLRSLQRATAGLSLSTAPQVAPQGWLGSYRLRREIGRGGMGIVFEAEDPTLGRRVALKVLPFAAVLDEKQLARFQNEAQAASRLHHPHIVPVYSVGTDRGIHFYAMQYVDGQSLEEAIAELRRGVDASWDERLFTSQVSNPASPDLKKDTRPNRTTAHGPGADASSRGGADLALEGGTTAAWNRSAPLPTNRRSGFIRKAVEIGRDVAMALQHAHDFGILHRDIKPSNLLIDQFGKVWITDFGLARVPGDAAVTSTGDVLGSARYMSPEQASGRRAFVDHRTDIYSLGITLYELLTLRPAFPTETREEFLRKVVSEDPPSIRRLNPAVPAHLASVIHRAIEKQPARRYATVQEFADDLDSFLQGKPTNAGKQRWRDAIRRWAQRHQRIMAMLLGLLAVLVAGSLLAGGLLVREQARTTAAMIQARENFERAERNFRDARLAVDDFGLRMSDRLASIPGAENIRREVLLESLKFYESFLTQAVSDASLRLEVAKTQLKVGRIHEQLGESVAGLRAYEAASATLNASGKSSIADRLVLAQALNNRGLLLARSGDPAAGMDRLSEALTIQRELKAVRPQDAEVTSDLACTLCNIALLHGMQDRSADALEPLEEAVRLQRAIVARQPGNLEAMQRLAIGLNHLSNLRQSDDLERAAELAAESCGLLESLSRLNPHNLDVLADLALSYNNLSALQVRSNQLGDAATEYQRAVGILQSLATRAPQVPAYRSHAAVALNNLGRVQLTLENVAAASAAFDRARVLLEELLENLGEEPELLGSLSGVCFNQGMALRALGEDKSAVSVLQQAIEFGSRARRLAPGNVQFSQQLEMQLDKLRQWNPPPESKVTP